MRRDVGVLAAAALVLIGSGWARSQVTGIPHRATVPEAPAPVSIEPEFIPPTAEEPPDIAPTLPARLTAATAADRMREVLIAAGCPAEDIPLEDIVFDDDDWRARRSWRYAPGAGLHIRIDADSGALLYLDAFRYVDYSDWEERSPSQSVTPAQAAALVENFGAGQYGTYRHRVFELTLKTPLIKWPQYDLEFKESVDPGTYANKMSALVDWGTGRIVEFIATNIDARYDGPIDEDQAVKAAIRRWEWAHAYHELPGALIGTRQTMEIWLRPGYVAYPRWCVTLQFSCQHASSNIHHQRFEVTVDGDTGRDTGWTTD